MRNVRMCHRWYYSFSGSCVPRACVSRFVSHSNWNQLHSSRRKNDDGPRMLQSSYTFLIGFGRCNVSGTACVTSINLFRTLKRHSRHLNAFFFRVSYAKDTIYQLHVQSLMTIIVRMERKMRTIVNVDTFELKIFQPRLSLAVSYVWISFKSTWQINVRSVHTMRYNMSPTSSRPTTYSPSAYVLSAHKCPLFICNCEWDDALCTAGDKISEKRREFDFIGVKNPVKNYSQRDITKSH